MTRVRTLDTLWIAAEDLGLEPSTDGSGDLLFPCPLCRDGGLDAVVRIRQLDNGGIAVSCDGLEAVGRDRWAVMPIALRVEDPGVDILTHDAEDSFVIAWSVFDLVSTIHTHRPS